MAAPRWKNWRGLSISLPTADMEFSYQSIDRQGQLHRGHLSASNAADLEDQLAARQQELIRCAPRRWPRLRRHHAIPRRELINLCFHLEQLTRAGVPLLDGLADLRDSLDHEGLQNITADLHRRIESGESLSQALGSHPEAFQPLFVHLIHAGEISGRIPEILASLGESLKWEDELAAQSKKLLLYPCFVAATVLSVTLFLMLFLVPQLKIFVAHMGQTLPLPTRLLFLLADTLFAYGPHLFGLLTGLLLSARFLIRRQPRWGFHLDRLKLRLPVLGPVLGKLILARFAALFALLYNAGIPVLDALDNTGKIIGNRPLAAALQQARDDIAEGRSIHDAFARSGLFPALILRMLHVGESTGNLDSALSNAAYFYQRDIRESVARLQTLIEPALTLFMGLLLGWIMLSVIGPVYDIITRIKP